MDIILLNQHSLHYQKKHTIDVYYVIIKRGLNILYIRLCYEHVSGYTKLTCMFLNNYNLIVA